MTKFTPGVLYSMRLQMSAYEVAERTGLSIAIVNKKIKKYREQTGKPAPPRGYVRRPGNLGVTDDRIEEMLQNMGSLR